MKLNHKRVFGFRVQKDHEGIVRHPTTAICPLCKFYTGLPAELLRPDWQDLECDCCLARLRYRGEPSTIHEGEYLIACQAMIDVRNPKGVEKTKMTNSEQNRPEAPKPAGKHDEGRSSAEKEIGRPQTFSDSSKYRRRFEIEGDDLMLLGAAAQAGQEAVNRYWQDLGSRLGFVWTKVSDFNTNDLDPDGETVSFWAEVEDAPIEFPAFDEWWRQDGKALPSPRYEIAREAFVAGSRSAATRLAQMDDRPVPEPRPLDTGRPALALGAVAIGSAGIGGFLTFAVMYLL